MSLIKKYKEGLSTIELYDDGVLNDNERENLLIEIYDICNSISKEINLNNVKAQKYFYTINELEKHNKKD